ncbi:hypothetical protein DERF_015851 [Dermatophagoides farinae]|uniref:Uncharacterized protein n=1 Tax=Dermatophagoides farinae TaxID=6954 RepID=A0A922HFD6_DERFA|nr:hypothetical protein DERF_015851 [Dermatophagoides farinae]
MSNCIILIDKNFHHFILTKQGVPQRKLNTPTMTIHSFPLPNCRALFVSESRSIGMTISTFIRCVTSCERNTSLTFSANSFRRFSNSSQDC